MNEGATHVFKVMVVNREMGIMNHLLVWTTETRVALLKNTFDRVFGILNIGVTSLCERLDAEEKADLDEGELDRVVGNETFYRFLVEQLIDDVVRDIHEHANPSKGKKFELSGGEIVVRETPQGAGTIDLFRTRMPDFMARRMRYLPGSGITVDQCRDIFAFVERYLSYRQLLTKFTGDAVGEEAPDPARETGRSVHMVVELEYNEAHTFVVMPYKVGRKFQYLMDRMSTEIQSLDGGDPEFFLIEVTRKFLSGARADRLATGILRLNGNRRIFCFQRKTDLFESMILYMARDIIRLLCRATRFKVTTPDREEVAFSRMSVTRDGTELLRWTFLKKLTVKRGGWLDFDKADADVLLDLVAFMYMVQKKRKRLSVPATMVLT